MKRIAPVLAVGLTLLACSTSRGSPSPASPEATATVEGPTETSLPPTSTPIPPTATPLPEVITDANVAELKVVATFAEGELVRSLAFSPDGTTLAAAVGDEAGLIRLFDVGTGASIRTIDGHDSIIWQLAFSPDGRFLASTARDYTAKVWDWVSGSLVHALDFPNEVVGVAFSPDSRVLAVGGADELPGTALQDAMIWTFAVDTWEPGPQFAEFWNIPAIAFTPDGALIVGGGTSRNVRVWRTSDGAQQFILYHSGQVSSLAISPDGSTVATGLCQQSASGQCTIGAIWLWDLATGRLLEKLADFPEVVVGVEFSADGSLVIGGSRDGTLHAYATSDYRPLLAATSSVGRASGDHRLGPFARRPVPGDRRRGSNQPVAGRTLKPIEGLAWND